jgi:hypothetical protein
VIQSIDGQTAFHTVHSVFGGIGPKQSASRSLHLFLCHLLAAFLHGLNFSPEGRGIMVHRNVALISADCTALYLED